MHKTRTWNAQRTPPSRAQYLKLVWLLLLLDVAEKDFARAVTQRTVFQIAYSLIGHSISIRTRNASEIERCARESGKIIDDARHCHHASTSAHTHARTHL